MGYILPTIEDYLALPENEDLVSNSGSEEEFGGLDDEGQDESEEKKDWEDEEEKDIQEQDSIEN